MVLDDPSGDIFLRDFVARLDRVHLEAIMIGNAAAQFHGAPVSTRDVDFFIRDTASNREKLGRLTTALGPEVRVTRIGELTEAVRLAGIAPPVDFLFSLGGGHRFESIRARAVKFSPESEQVWVASLKDVIAAKETAGRPKDKAVMWILKQTLEAREKLLERLDQAEPPKAAERRATYRRKRVVRRRQPVHR